MHSYQHLIILGRRRRHLLDAKHVVRAIRGLHNRFHLRLLSNISPIDHADPIMVCSWCRRQCRKNTGGSGYWDHPGAS